MDARTFLIVFAVAMLAGSLAMIVAAARAVVKRRKVARARQEFYAKYQPPKGRAKIQDLKEVETLVEKEIPGLTKAARNRVARVVQAELKRRAREAQA